jgi:hypothetical protein
VVILRASEISGGARIMVGKVSVVAIVLPPSDRATRGRTGLRPLASSGRGRTF